MSTKVYLYIKLEEVHIFFARIWDPINKKYLTRSTKETTRIDAREVAQLYKWIRNSIQFRQQTINKLYEKCW